jgi:hypothetical protein
VAIREYKWQADGDKMEMGFFQLRLAETLDDAGWLNPLGEKIMKPTASSSGSAENCNDCLIENSNIGVTGIEIQVRTGASATARAAAHALNEELKSEYFAVGELPWSADALVAFAARPKPDRSYYRTKTIRRNTVAKYAQKFCSSSAARLVCEDRRAVERSGWVASAPAVMPEWARSARAA